MVATSLKAAQSLVALCEFSTDATRAHNGILIGNGSIHIITSEEEQGITRCLDRSPDITTSYRSAFMPLQHAVTGGTLYQTGDIVLASQDNGRGLVVVKILNFYLQYVPVVIGDLYKAIRDEENNVLRHPLSDSIIIEPSQTNFCLRVRDLKRKAMLYIYNPGYALIDPDRKLILPRVIVPVFPQAGDMVLVKGNDDEIWKAEIRAVDHNVKCAKGYFFIKHRNWDTNRLWQRESSRRAMDQIHYKSILGLVDGQWQGPYWKDN